LFLFSFCSGNGGQTANSQGAEKGRAGGDANSDEAIFSQRFLCSNRELFDLMISRFNAQDLLAFSHAILVLFLSEKPDRDKICVISICRHILMFANELFEEIDALVDVAQIFGEDERVRELEI
jgi:hypothetical protein